MDLGFEWDRLKAEANERKHGVSFDEATTVFSDERAILIPDPDNSEQHEFRYLLLGVSWTFRILVVVHCYRERPDFIRIISARRATRSERAQYGVGNL